MHFDVFSQVQQWTNDPIKRVLYPGCHRHLTASLIFPQVTYIDSDEKVAEFYADKAVEKYIDENKVYDDDVVPRHYEFHCHDVNHPLPTGVGKDFDLLISLSAGLVTEPCSDYVRNGGYLLVNDAHSDARTTFVRDNDWELIAYCDEESGDGKGFTDSNLNRCFRVKVPRSKETQPMTQAQAEESVKVGSRSKRSFKMPFEPMFYLFQKK